MLQSSDFSIPTTQSTPTAQWLNDEQRLHLSQGPIDLIVEAEGENHESNQALIQATTAFNGLLQALADELPALRTDCRQLIRDGVTFKGPVSRRMLEAVEPHARKDSGTFVTPMAAVAGSVADHMLLSLCKGRQLDRAYVNNGGDIALFLAPGAVWRIGICTDVCNATIGASLSIHSSDGIGGIATSGWSGRSFSLGIADAVTVLAGSAAAADVAATLIANAVDVPSSDKVTRVPARMLSPDSDLGDHAVTTAVDKLDPDERHQALEAGVECARSMKQAGLIRGAFLALQGDTRVVDIDPARLML